MSIQHKILQFRKEKMLAGRSGDGLVYRVSKDEAIEVAKFRINFLNKLAQPWEAQTWEAQTLIINAEFAIKMASEREFKMLHEFISSSVIIIFGVEIHPDWQEFTNKNMYY